MICARDFLMFLKRPYEQWIYIAQIRFDHLLKFPCSTILFYNFHTIFNDSDIFKFLIRILKKCLHNHPRRNFLFFTPLAHNLDDSSSRCQATISTTLLHTVRPQFGSLFFTPFVYNFDHSSSPRLSTISTTLFHAVRPQFRPIFFTLSGHNFDHSFSRCQATILTTLLHTVRPQFGSLFFTPFVYNFNHSSSPHLSTISTTLLQPVGPSFCLLFIILFGQHFVCYAMLCQVDMISADVADVAANIILTLGNVCSVIWRDH